MVELKSIEQLLHFMRNHIQLSRYDEKFIDNLSTLKQVTTNQVILFHSLIQKYKRQFAKHELHVDKLVDLNWNVKVVESSPQYTNGNLVIENDVIYFKCPFNRAFIDSFRKVPYNKFIWNKDKRHYETPYNQYSLKILLKSASKYFNDINMCPVSQSLLEAISQFDDSRYWNPTMVSLNGNFFIVAINESLNEALGDMVLNNDIDTLAMLAGYGITIDKSVHTNTPKEIFSASSVIEIEQYNIKQTLDWLNELGCDMVYLSGLLNLYKKKIVEYLDDLKIDYYATHDIKEPDRKYKFPVLIRLRKGGATYIEPYKVSKVIHIVNSLPIDIK